MQSTITLQTTLNLMSTHADLLPLSGVGGYTNEPALSLCNDAVAEIINDEQDWKWNRVELCSSQQLTLGTAQPLATCQNKQDYLFAGASAFVLSVSSNSSPSSGASIGLASSSAITVASGTVTVNTLEPHRFKVGQTVYMMGVTMATGTSSKYNSTFTDDGNSTSWAGGWAITAVTSTSFSFAAASGQNNSDVGGAPGLVNFGWLTDASMIELNNNSSPVNNKPLKAERHLPAWSKIDEPQKVCVLSDNGAGVLTVRFYFVPGSTIFLVNLIYQKAAPVLTALSQTWSPIPDNYGHLVRQALFYRMYRYLNSPRADVEYQKFLKALQDGKGSDSAEESNVYLEPEDSLVDYGPYWAGF